MNAYTSQPNDNKKNLRLKIRFKKSRSKFQKNQCEPHKIQIVQVKPTGNQIQQINKKAQQKFCQRTLSKMSETNLTRYPQLRNMTQTMRQTNKNIYREKSKKLFSKIQQIHPSLNFRQYHMKILENKKFSIFQLDKQQMCTIPQQVNQVQKIQQYNHLLSELKIRKCPNFEYLPFKKPKSLINLKKELYNNNNNIINQIKPYRLNIEMSTEFQNKLSKFLEFLFIVNLSNRIYRNLNITYTQPLRYIIQPGNNSSLIRKIMKKRFWWEQSNSAQIQFCWSPNKKSDIHKKQQNNKQKYYDILKSTNVNKSLHLQDIQLIKNQNKIISKLLKIDDWNILRYTLLNDKQSYLQKCKKIHQFIKINNINQFPIVTNHLPLHDILSNKKSLFLSLKLYYKLIKQDLWSIIPETYYLTDLQNSQFLQFQDSFHSSKKKVWIIKPGEFTNRGNGIILSKNFAQITNHIKTQEINSQPHTFIVQNYITNPFLYNRRKFDIRTYMLVTINNGIIKGYWYNEGYIRTSSSIFELNELSNLYIHLTNDAIQKYSQNYGKYENGNKLSYSQFQRYLDNVSTNIKYNFQKDIHPRMKKIAFDCLAATNLFLDVHKKQHNFQIFGLDFIIDANFTPFLLEINTNPCLQTGCHILQKIIPTMLQNAFRLGLDPIYPPPIKISPKNYYHISQNAIIHNNFQLLFDEITDGKKINTIFENNIEELSKISSISEKNRNQY